jgi:GT2 family glycosyltransferase
VTARIDQVAWLTDGVALFVGTFTGEVVPTDEALLGVEAVQVRSLRYIHPESDAQLMTVWPASRSWPGERLGQLRVSTPTDVTFDPADLGEVIVDLQTLLRSALAPLQPAARARVLEFLATTPEAHPSAGGTPLTRSLVTVREALRERLKPGLVGQNQAIGLAVECVLAVDDHRFFVQGWFRDAEAPVISLRLVSPEGAATELIERMYLFQRTDLEVLYDVGAGDPSAGSGFAACFDLVAPSRAAEGWVLELRDAAGNAVEVPAPRVISGRDEVRNRLLGDIDLEFPGEDRLTRQHLFPAISRLQERNSAQLRIDKVVQFGKAPASPAVSIVIPLYRRTDLLEHQLAQFSLDPEIPRTDLIYVLDSPELAREVIRLASPLADLYRVPFRVAVLAQNIGFAGANMAGVSLARGRLLLFMNSDVFPERPSWLGEMVSFYDATPRIGALGPKLLFEDDSIQHAGMFFRRTPDASLWINEHYFKGLHRDFPASRVSRIVPAVSAACMLIERDLFTKVGGFGSSFVRGDFEDSDLCVRLWDAGRDNRYLADVVLYHLEGQSYESHLRQHAWRYNAWLQANHCGDRISQLMNQFKSDIPGEMLMTPDLIPEVAPRVAINGGAMDPAEVR